MLTISIYIRLCSSRIRNRGCINRWESFSWSSIVWSCNLNSIGRAEYVDVTDEEAVCAFEYLSKTEGIIPAIESAHAVAAALKIAPTMPKDSILVINLSGRGDKDVYSIARYRGVDLVEE